jgi:hypothetical protein
MTKCRLYKAIASVIESHEHCGKKEIIVENPRLINEF